MEAIGIDIGTTSICGAVLDTVSGEVLRSVTENSGAFIKTGKIYEKIQSVEKITALALDILNALITDNTAVIGVTGQMHGILYTDKNGKAVSPLYTWQDGRGNLEYKNGLTYAEYLRSNTGYGNVTDFYNRQNGLIPENAVSYCTIQDYLVMVLCGLEKALVHCTNGASFGNYDLKTGKFDYDCNINVTDGYVLAGRYKNIPVSIAIGDNQASVLASATEKDVLINVGTGSQISIISDRIIDSETIETRPYFDGKYLNVGSALCGGRAYAILKDFYKSVFSYKTELSDVELYEIMGEMAKKSAMPLKVDTRFSGTRGDKNKKGSVKGITELNFTPEGLTVGVLEGIIEELTEMYEGMGVSRNGLVGSGNGIRKNEFLVRTAERKTGMKMRIPKNCEEAAVGAAIYGAVSAGIYSDIRHATERVVKYL